MIIAEGKGERTMKDKSITQLLEEIREDLCDNYCKYRDTCDENCECDITRDGGTCPLDRL